MTQPRPAAVRLSIDEYLRREERSQRRHEYVNGNVFVMTGTTLRHNRILRNIARRLDVAAQSGPCEVFTEAIKVRIRDERFYYPDVVVSCAPASDEDVYLRDPCLIVEVTSTRTQATDRREKAPVYQSIPSLRSYLIVHHKRRHVEMHARGADGSWERGEVAAVGAIEVPCPRMTLTLDEIYRGVSLPKIGERAPARYVVAP